MARLFNEDQELYIRENVLGISNQELANKVNEKFDLSITCQQMKTWKSNHNLSSGLTGYFEKGFIPYNKGKKMPTVGRMAETQFKKGQQPINYKPVGSERVDRDGYVIIKVQDDGPWHKRWRAKHKVLWESVHGPIPKGHKLIFLNQDRNDIRFDNLKLITDAEMLQMNRNKWVFDNAEATEVGVNLAKLKLKSNERKRYRKNEFKGEN